MSGQSATTGANTTAEWEPSTAAPHTGRHLRRYREVVGVLVRHGLGFLLGKRQPPHVPLLGGGHAGDAPAGRPAHLRLALEELGVTFIKLGQILSTRADLLPPAYRDELARLQDHAPPIGIDAVRAVIAAEFGRPVEEVFASFDAEPLATGSIGQAHAATLATGEAVVVKVRRPGAVAQVEEDLRILQALAASVARHWAGASRYDVVGLAREFAETLRAELDYGREARNADRFAANFAAEPNVHIPRIIQSRSRGPVLTLERITGAKIDDLAALAAAGVDQRTVAERTARLALKMVLDDGFFHADPHPGNFFVEADGRLALIDFGMVGTLTLEARDGLVDLALAVSANDADGVIDAFLSLGIAGRVRRERLRGDVTRLLDRYLGRPLGEVAIGPLLNETLTLVRRHGLRLPPDLALLTKTLMMVEGLGARLDPEFRLTPLLGSFARRLVLRRYALGPLLRRLGQAGSGTLRLAEEAPPQLLRLLREIEREGMQVGLREEAADALTGRLERLVNRLVLGMITSAFIIGLASLVAVYRPPGWTYWADAAFAIGLGIAAALGGYLVWVILRSRRA